MVPVKTVTIHITTSHYERIIAVVEKVVREMIDEPNAVFEIGVTRAVDVE